MRQRFEQLGLDLRQRAARDEFTDSGAATRAHDLTNLSDCRDVDCTTGWRIVTGVLHVSAQPAGVNAPRPALGPPAGWTGTAARSSGWVEIPDHVDPTNPCRVYELDDPAQRKYVYEIVLTDGTDADINGHIDRALLADMWERLYLPTTVRAAWTRVLRAGSDPA
jgi:hypothetical protein